MYYCVDVICYEIIVWNKVIIIIHSFGSCYIVFLFYKDKIYVALKFIEKL